MTAQTNDLQFIALNKLIVSPRNVRRLNRKADLDALAASIAANGLLQNLCVVPTDRDKYEVDAGGRRLLALKQLASAGILPKDHLVPCHVISVEKGLEVSLAENVQRVAMDAMDEVEAYAALVSDGATAEDVARRFGVTRRHVDQRLALSGLSPRIKAAWKRGDLTLEAARAFCLVDDHAQQEAVYKSLSKPVSHAGVVRARLTEGRMRASDRLVRFVGLEAYELAGGAILRDLFDDDAVYVTDPGLVTLLAEQKLNAQCEGYLAQGWGWVDVSVGGPRRDEGYAPLRLQPDWREHTEAEQAELSQLRQQLDALDAELEETSVEDDARWNTRDDIAGHIEALRQEARVWDSDLIARAGVVLSVDHEGCAHATCGVIRSSDEKDLKSLQKQKARAADNLDEDSEQDLAPHAEMLPPESGLPKAVLRELSLARTRALRILLSKDHEAALAVTVASMLMRVMFTHELPGISVAAYPARIDDLDALEDTRSALLVHVPADSDRILAWCLDQSVETLLPLLAILVASSVDLTHEKGAPGDRRRQAVADELAVALDLDMRSYWCADITYWARLPKAELLLAIADAPGLLEMSATKRETVLGGYAKLKRDELAAKADAAFGGEGYLPDMLVTPLERGAVEIVAGVPAVAAE